MFKALLREYQEEAVNAAILGFQQEVENAGGPFDKQMIVLPTGAGKTVCFSAMADYWIEQNQKRTLILVDQTDLVDQARDEMLQFTTHYPQIEQADRKAMPGADCVIATVQTMAHRMEKFAPDHFGLVIADECDRAIAPIWQKVLNYFDPHAKVLGVTATPDRGDQRSVMDYFERIAYEVPLFDLIKQGFLSKIMVRNIPITMDISNVKQDAGDYDKQELAEALEPFFDEVCDAILEHAPGRKTLVFLPLISTSHRFVERALAHGIKAEHIDGTSSDREDIKQRFKRRETDMLCNAMLLGRGYNDRSIDCIVNLRPTRSAALYRQFVGRGTRTFCPHGCPAACDHPDAKKDLLLLDFLWTHNKLGLQRPANLVARDVDHAKQLTDFSQRQSGTTLNLEGIDSLVAKEAELALLKQLRAAAKGHKPGYFNAMEVAIALQQQELIHYEAVAKWERQPASDKQLAALEKMGFDPESIKDRGQASRLFDLVNDRRKKDLATLKQLRFLRRIKYKDAEKVTFAGARAIMDNRFSRVPIPFDVKIYFEETSTPQAQEPPAPEPTEPPGPVDPPMPTEPPAPTIPAAPPKEFVSEEMAGRRAVRMTQDPEEEREYQPIEPPPAAEPTDPNQKTKAIFAEMKRKIAAIEPRQTMLL